MDFVQTENDQLVKGGWSGLATGGIFAIYAVFDYDSDSQSIVNFQDDLYFNKASLNPYGKRLQGSGGDNGGVTYSGGPYDAPAIFNANLHYHVSETCRSVFSTPTSTPCR